VLADMGLTEAEVPSPLSVLRTLSVLFVCVEKGPFLPLSVSVVRVSLCSCLHGGLYGAPHGRDLYFTISLSSSRRRQLSVSGRPLLAPVCTQSVCSMRSWMRGCVNKALSSL
jgi:hypothetical protein